jgi:hypothetical protein
VTGAHIGVGSHLTLGRRQKKELGGSSEGSLIHWSITPVT